MLNALDSLSAHQDRRHVIWRHRPPSSSPRPIPARRPEASSGLLSAKDIMPDRIALCAKELLFGLSCSAVSGWQSKVRLCLARFKVLARTAPGARVLENPMKQNTRRLEQHHSLDPARQRSEHRWSESGRSLRQNRPSALAPQPPGGLDHTAHVAPLSARSREFHRQPRRVAR